MSTPEANPIIAEVTRGDIIESVHRGAYAVVGPGGELLEAAGDIAKPIYPRSAMKALQALPLVVSGAAKHYGLNDAELALVCASHNGEARHVEAAKSVLTKAGRSSDDLACGSQWPRDGHQLIKSGGQPRQVHNNCSGKHAGMLALASFKHHDPHDYWRVEHPVQQIIMQSLSQILDHDLGTAPVALDGCSAPNWAFPLKNFATGLSCFVSGERLDAATRAAAKTLSAATRANPFMVAGTDRFCTRLMTAVPRAFVKTGAEGVFAAAIPHMGIGIALKCDDGHRRAAEVATAALLARLGKWEDDELAALQSLARETIMNRNAFVTGEIKSVL